MDGGCFHALSVYDRWVIRAGGGPVEVSMPWLLRDAGCRLVGGVIPNTPGCWGREEAIGERSGVGSDCNDGDGDGAGDEDGLEVLEGFEAGEMGEMEDLVGGQMTVIELFRRWDVNDCVDNDKWPAFAADWLGGSEFASVALGKDANCVEEAEVEAEAEARRVREDDVSASRPCVTTSEMRDCMLGT